MKRIIKRVIALCLAAAMSTGLCLSANALSAYKDFPGDEGYELTFRLYVTSRNVGGNGPYQLVVQAVETDGKPYYYPYLYVKGTLFGTGSSNSVAEETFDNAYKGTVTTGTIATAVCEGHGRGEFRAYGNDDYGEVSGYLYNY